MRRDSLINAMPHLDQGLPLTTVVDPDWDVIVIILAGQPEHFRLLYRRHHPRVRSLLFQLCGAPAVDDLVQEVFFRAWKGLPRLQRRAKFTTWLYRITCNVAHDYRRQAARRCAQAQTWQTETPPSIPAPDLAELHYQDVVKRGLETLGRAQREVLVLHDLEGLAQREIAQILSIPVGTVKSRLFHARQKVRQFFEQEGIAL